MKNVLSLMLGLVSLLIAGCATTAHDFCIDPDNASHYGSYQECYSEKQAEKQLKAQRRREAWDHMFDGFKNNDRQLSCQTYNFGNVSQTSCR